MTLQANTYPSWVFVTYACDFRQPKMKNPSRRWLMYFFFLLHFVYLAFGLIFEQCLRRLIFKTYWFGTIFPVSEFTSLDYNLCLFLMQISAFGWRFLHVDNCVVHSVDYKLVAQVWCHAPPFHPRAEMKCFIIFHSRMISKPVIKQAPRV